MRKCIYCKFWWFKPFKFKDEQLCPLCCWLFEERRKK